MDAESKFSSHLTNLCLARATARAESRLVNKLKLFSRIFTTRGKISLRNQGTLLV